MSLETYFDNGMRAPEICYDKFSDLKEIPIYEEVADIYCLGKLLFRLYKLYLYPFLDIFFCDNEDEIN